MLTVDRSHAVLWGSLEECNSCHDTMRSHVVEILHMHVSGSSLQFAVMLVASVLHYCMFLAACHVASRQHVGHQAQSRVSTLQRLP